MLKSPYKIKHYYPSKVFIPYDNYWSGEYIDPRDLTENKDIFKNRCYYLKKTEHIKLFDDYRRLPMEDKVNKTLHLKRERVDKSKYKFPQGLTYDLTDWTENDIHLLDRCLTAFKEHSDGEFDFYVGEYGLIGGDPLDSDAPDGFYPVVDQARKEYGETLKNK